MPYMAYWAQLKYKGNKMKTVNIKSGSLVTQLRPRFDSDKYPCYHAELEK